MKKRKIKKIHMFFIGLILLGAFLGCTVFFYGYSVLSKIKKVEMPTSEKELGIKNIEVAENDQQMKLRNILLMGVDREEGVTDTMIVLTINEEDNSFKLTSIMRDSYVDMGEGKVTKLNYAYKYGGALNTVKVINETYLLDIRDYLLVNIDSLKEIIDSLGGVEINVSKEERSCLNVTRNGQTVSLEKSGLQILSGDQAVAYTRLRTVGNCDFQRTERGRTVLLNLFQKIKAEGSVGIPQIISDVAPFIETSLSNSELVKISEFVFKSDKNSVKQLRLPIDNTWKDNTSSYYWLEWDKEKNLDALHEFIYGNKDRLK